MRGREGGRGGGGGESEREREGERERCTSCALGPCIEQFTQTGLPLPFPPIFVDSSIS